ncbi:MAG: hypothetical protein HUU15_17555, partial [Candidatus Brocadiae bacterium]|nr:hypothetical protein [Candidatus Brocadiia bacterium]
SEDLDGEALAAAKRLAPEGTTLHGCAAVELPPGPLATAVRQKARFFRASYRDAAGSQPQLTLRLSPDGRAEPWAGDVAGLAELQSELGILASGPEGTRQAAQLCAALRAAAGEPGFLAEAEARRSEAGERSALFHLKTLWLGSGVLGYYHDRVDFTFDGAGLLSGMNQVTESLTVERMEELLAEADPLLRLDGWVTDARRRDLERRQRRGR